MFGGGVWWTWLGSDVPQTRHERNTSIKRSIRRDLGTLWGREEMLLEQLLFPSCVAMCGLVVSWALHSRLCFLLVWTISPTFQR
jgi:hypothetical protein